MNQYPKLINAEACNEFVMLLEYANGEKRYYDFSPNLEHSFYQELSNPALFKKMTVNNGAIGWPTGQDFCPHTLYEKSQIINSDNFEEIIASIKQAKAVRAFNTMRSIAEENGFMSEEEIEAEIMAVREQNK